jgi:hypothetical protein
MKTEEGRRILDLEIERYRELVALKKFIIAQINDKPFQWGWGSGNSARDILKADEAGFELRGGKAAWPDVDEAQFRKLLLHCLPETLDRVLRARHLLAAAAYFQVTGNSSLAQTYSKQAVQWNSNLRDSARRLVPE